MNFVNPKIGKKAFHPPRISIESVLMAPPESILDYRDRHALRSLRLIHFDESREVREKLRECLLLYLGRDTDEARAALAVAKVLAETRGDMWVELHHADLKYDPMRGFNQTQHVAKNHLRRWFILGEVLTRTEFIDGRKGERVTYTYFADSYYFRSLLHLGVGQGGIEIVNLGKLEPNAALVAV